VRATGTEREGAPLSRADDDRDCPSPAYLKWRLPHFRHRRRNSRGRGATRRAAPPGRTLRPVLSPAARPGPPHHPILRLKVLTTVRASMSTDLEIRVEGSYGPAADELEVTVFGPGFGECIVAHLGHDRWIVIDSCIDSRSDKPAVLAYFEHIGVD